jgi:hypothetical protein
MTSARQTEAGRNWVFPEFGWQLPTSSTFGSLTPSPTSVASPMIAASTVWMTVGRSPFAQETEGQIQMIGVPLVVA